MGVFNGDVLRVSMNFELADGTQYQNIYHYIRDGTDVYDDAAHIAAINTRMASAYDELVSWVRSDVVERLSFVDRVEFNEITDQWAVVENIGTFTMPFVPVGSLDGLPFQCSPYIIFKTARPRTVGKKFLFPFTEAAQDQTILETSAVTAIVAMAADLVSAIALGGDATLTPGVPRTGVNSWFNFLVAVVNDLLGTQKRRRPGVGG